MAVKRKNIFKGVLSYLNDAKLKEPSKKISRDFSDIEVKAYRVDWWRSLNTEEKSSTAVLHTVPGTQEQVLRTN